MSTPYIGRQAVTIVRRSDGPPDALGVPTVVETETAVTGCSVQPLSTAEDISDVDQVITRWRLYAPAGITVTATDAVIADGTLFSVDGDPQTWPGLNGTPHHTECYLRRATG
jgi:hypothetical protein